MKKLAPVFAWGTMQGPAGKSGGKALVALAQIVFHHRCERQQHHDRAENLKGHHLKSPFWKYALLIRAFG